MDLEEYIRQGEPEQSEKSTAWKTDIYNITKSEWVLNGETVLYASADSIRDTLDYDFGQEKQFSYEGLSAGDAVKHIAKFTSGIWQIYPFCEGNTRSTAVFIIKYLKTFGFSVNNEIFAENSWYFRNSLARANYNDLDKGISATTIYLERFFENLLMGYQNELKNRFIHVDYKEQSAIQSAKVPNTKCHNGTMKMTLEEMAIIKVLQKEPSATQKRIAELTGKSERTIKRRTVEMQEKGLIRRENGKRNGRWGVLVKL
jgi:DNA-binding MarR family transcriptional regulator